MLFLSTIIHHIQYQSLIFMTDWTTLLARKPKTWCSYIFLLTTVVNVLINHLWLKRCSLACGILARVQFSELARYFSCSFIPWSSVYFLFWYVDMRAAVLSLVNQKLTTHKTSAANTVKARLLYQKQIHIITSMHIRKLHVHSLSLLLYSSPA